MNENEIKNNFENNENQLDVYSSNKNIFDSINNSFITSKNNYRRKSIIARQNYK